MITCSNCPLTARKFIMINERVFAFCEGCKNHYAKYKSGGIVDGKYIKRNSSFVEITRSEYHDLKSIEESLTS